EVKAASDASTAASSGRSSDTFAIASLSLFIGSSRFRSEAARNSPCRRTETNACYSPVTKHGTSPASASDRGGQSVAKDKKKKSKGGSTGGKAAKRLK